MYNSKAYHTNPPTSLADFFDPKRYPGKRVVLGDPTAGLLEAALLGVGVNQSRLYPLDIKRALSVYDRIKPDLTISPTNGAEQQAMVGNQADMALVVSSRAYTVLKAGGTFWRPVWDKLPVGWDTLVIPKGSPHSDLATQFIKFASQPVQSADFASTAGLGAANTSAAVKLNPLQQEVDAFSAAHKPNLVYLDGEWWTANLDKVVTAWTNWTTG
jgi:putative spermidine/putrescine transport system substrate-binding protein